MVSRDTFVNARPVARNVVSVPARELAAAPVSHMVAVEPVRSSVLGAGRPVANRPPAAVTSRPVVALRTPAPMPRSFDQRQAQAGGHLNQQSSSLVRQEAPGQASTGRSGDAAAASGGWIPFVWPTKRWNQPNENAAASLGSARDSRAAEEHAGSERRTGTHNLRSSGRIRWPSRWLPCRRETSSNRGSRSRSSVPGSSSSPRRRRRNGSRIRIRQRRVGECAQERTLTRTECLRSDRVRMRCDWQADRSEGEKEDSAGKRENIPFPARFFFCDCRL